MFVFPKIWRALYSCYLRFEIHPFAILLTTCRNSFSYNYLKTIQVVLVHMSEAVLQGFYHKNMVYYHLHMQQN